ncbi:hypothetical protein ACFL6C_00765 [Myxococcota bacterium]
MLKHLVTTGMALTLGGTAACEAPAYTIAELEVRGITMNGRSIGLEGEITHADVPRTRRIVQVADAKSDLRAVELRDRTGRLVVWYNPDRLVEPLKRGDRVAIDAHVSFPAEKDAAGRASEMVVVARRVRLLE